ncbi:MAG: toxin-antitoxin system YwqK family antitoxin [Chitinophagaceae bacterium]
MTSIILSIFFFVYIDFIDPDKRNDSRWGSGREKLKGLRYVGKYDNGQLMFRTTLKKGLLHGQWESWYVNGIKRDSGNIKSSIPNGIWKTWYPNGNLMYQVHFSSVKYHQITNEIFRQPKYKLYHLSELPREQAIIHLKSPFLKNKMDLSDISYALTPFSSDEYKKNLSNEMSEYGSPFNNAVLHGEFTSYYENGDLKEQGVLLNGLKDGVWEEKTKEGFYQRGTYFHGKKIGEWRLYNSNGKPIKFSQYSGHGKLLSEYDFNKKGVK